MPSIDLPPAIRLISVLCPANTALRRELYKFSILVLTFLAYTSYHLSRKPISIVKNSHVFLDCEHANVTGTCTSWIEQIDGKTEKEAKTYLGLLDTTYLFSYAFFMFGSGFVAERVDLRYFLSLGMIFSGLTTSLFGFAFPFSIHSLWYLLFIQIVTGMFQATGWPGVVSVMANWFGKGRRGLIMGLWNSHTSLGNILGSLIAGAYVKHNWGMSFTVPGMIIAGMGFIIFLFMVPRPSHLGFDEVTSSPDAESEPLLEEDKEGEAQRWEQEDQPRVEVRGNQEETAIGFLGALKIPGVVEFSLCLFFAKLVSYTFLYWLPNYIHVMDKVDAEEAANLSTIFDIGGILGGIIAGIISDKSGNPASTCGIMLVVAIPSMLMYEDLVKSWCPISADHGSPVHNSCFIWNVILTLVTGVLVNGPYALITTAVSAELGQHPSLQGSSKALATVTAIIDGTGSIGAAIGPFLAGALTGNGNWDSVFYMLMIADVLALLFLTRLIVAEVRVHLRRRGRITQGGRDYRSINS